ncbi:MAG: response regulator, partial [Desulfobacterales bacterium]|nr:response regulator [Desulfobacterales bacterium]
MVDDDITIRRIVISRLTKLGHEAKAAEDGMQALDMLDSESFDLILLDQGMPEMDGVETMTMIRERKHPHRPPVIMMTAYSSLQLAVAFMQAGGTDYVEKPVDFDVLGIKIERSIEMARKVRREIDERKRAEEALQKAHDELEAQVEARTAELVAANQALQVEIIERKQAETELKWRRDHLEELVDARARELKASEEKFRTVADFAYDWEYWVRPDMTFNYISPSCGRITGYRAAEFLENPSLLIEIIHPEDRKRFQAHRDEIHKQEKSGALTFRVITRNGRTIWMEHGCQAVYGVGGAYLGQRCSNRDITEKMKAEEALRQEMEQREQAEQQLKILVRDLDRTNADLQDFAYVVSHDLKAPLRGVISLADWIQEDYADLLGREGRARFDKLIVRTRRMHHLIDGILQYSRAGSIGEKIGSKARPLDVEALVRETIDTLSPPDHIAVKIEGRLPAVTHDKTLLAQVFQNLIGNAIKHLGRPRGRVVVSHADLGDAWEYCVRDDGVGIEESRLEQIFNLFRAFKSPDDEESTGIGLSLVKRIVERIGGRVRVTSTPGAGSA